MLRYIHQFDKVFSALQRPALRLSPFLKDASGRKLTTFY